MNTRYVFEMIYNDFFAGNFGPRYIPKGGWVDNDNYYCVAYDHPVTGDRVIERYMYGPMANYVSMEYRESINLALDKIV